MRNRTPKSYTLIFALLLAMIVTACGGSSLQFEWSQYPDDDISQAIYETIGKKKMYYYGKHYSQKGEVAWYEYKVRDYEDEDVLTSMVEAANAVLEEKKETGKICLSLLEEMPGGYESVAVLGTYYEDEDEYVQYGYFQTLYILGTERSHMSGRSPYDKISTYINLPDIKSLVVSKKIAQAAEDEGIDWYEIWPELEYYEVLED